MKTKLTHRLWAKILAVFLLFLSVIAGICAGVGFFYCASTGMYTQPIDYYQSDICYQDAHELAWEAANIFYHQGLETTERWLEELDGYSNAHVRILDRETGKILAASSYPAAVENRDLEDSSYYRGAGAFAESFSFDYRGEVWQEEVVTEWYVNEAGERIPVAWESVERVDMAKDALPVFDVVIAVASPLMGVSDDFYRHTSLYNNVAAWRFTFPGILGGCLLLALVSLIFLLCGAGHRAGHEEIVLGALDRVPLDLMAAVYIFIWVLATMFFDGLTGDNFFLALGSGCVAAVLLLALLISFAARVKAGKFWQNTILWRLWIWLGRALKRCGVLCRKVYGALPMIWKAVLVLAALSCAEFLLILLMFETGTFGVLVFLMVNFVLFLALCFGVWQLSMLKKAGESLAGGEVDRKIDTKYMYWEFRKHGENLNAIGHGMAIAVEQKMRSERLKTELITNVSHDIKTPLTSIVSYVDLLQRPDVTEAERKEYLDVLARQSARLKKLTEDLVEASKASTGNMAVNLVSTNVEELLNQSVAEYSERFAAAKLDIIMDVRQRELTALADGRLLWRVMDNLLNNAAKYALAGTRVYLTAEAIGETVKVAVKNISREPLNVSEEELMERFVRGDTARSTEGSGLGLNIARSLTQLQGGSLDLTIDGDLFKAELTLRKGE